MQKLTVDDLLVQVGPGKKNPGEDLAMVAGVFFGLRKGQSSIIFFKFAMRKRLESYRVIDVPV